MKKVYEVKGMMEWHPMFVAGRARIQVSFTGGHLGEGCVTPARYETTDPVIQRIIELSEAFKSGRISLGRCFPEASSADVDEPYPAKNAPLESKTPSRMKTMDFENLEAAQEYLNFNKEVSMSKIMDKQGCMAQGQLLGLDIRFKE